DRLLRPQHRQSHQQSAQKARRAGRWGRAHSECARSGLCLYRRDHSGSAMIRGLYLKIFVWFSAATLLTSAAVFLITVATHSQSLGPSWMIGVLDQYARSAVDIYVHGGKPRLEKYLQDIEDSSFLQSTLFDPQNRDILGRGVPAGAEEVLAQARATG